MTLRRTAFYVTLMIGFLGGLKLAAEARADGDSDEPSASAIAYAKGTSDLMTNTIVAALVQEINETTPDNAPQGSQSIGLIFNDDNRDMRLVGTLDPVSANDRPADGFETTALQAAMSGQPYTEVQRVSGRWYYRRSIPLSNFAPQCAHCHSNFAALAATDYVGALMLRVPIRD